MHTERIAGTREIAQRMVNAEINFDGILMEIAGISAEEAAKIRTLYLARKWAKMDAVGGRISVKHGAYLDASSILCAKELTE